MRYGLSALLAAVILSCAARADEDAAVKLVEKLGGKIKRDNKQPNKPVVEANLYLAEMKDTDLKRLKDLQQVTKLNLSVTDVTDAGVKELQEALPKCKIYH